MNGRSQDPIISVRGLAKSFDGLPAIRSLDLEVRADQMFGLIGPDGGGKTTLLRILCGLVIPDAGDVQVLGFDSVRDQDRIKDDIGYMPQRFSLYPDLTVAENLRFFADIYSVPRAEREQRTERLMEFSRLAPFARRRAGALSGGMKQKLALSCTLIHTPRLLILDEPTTGVDPVSRGEFWEILAELRRQGVTILVTTPYMDEAARCDCAALMYQGQILTRGTPDQITGQCPHKLIRVYTPKAQVAAQILKESSQYSSVELYGDRVHVAALDLKRDLKSVEQTLQQANIPFSSMEEAEPELEDTFVYLVTHRNENDGLSHSR